MNASTFSHMILLARLLFIIALTSSTAIYGMPTSLQIGEPTYIDRNWGEKYGRITYKSLGASVRITYNISENLGVSLLENVLLRTDNAHRYDISPPKVFSTYLGITYTFKRD